MRVKIFFILSFMFFSTFFSQMSQAQAAPYLFLIPDGTITYQTTDFFRSEAASDPYSIEWIINYSVTEEIVVTSLSNSIVKFEKEYSVTVNNAYQKKDSNTYFPTHYGLKFYDEDNNLLGADNSTILTFSLTRNVNKLTGERVLAQNPYGATVVKLVVFYDSKLVYVSTTEIISNFGVVGSPTNIFNVNATDWVIGTIVEENFTVSGENTIHNYETWVLERNNIPQGYSSYSSIAEYEKSSGFYIKRTIEAIKTDDLYYKYTHQVIDLAGFIDDGYPDVLAPAGQIVNSLDPIVIIFQGTDSHFELYNLYRNGTLYETNNTFRSEWNFSLTPSSGNTSWTFEIVDSLGYSSNATTWLMYQPLPTTTTTEIVNTTTTSESTTSDTGIASTPSFDLFLCLVALIPLVIPVIKKRH